MPLGYGRSAARWRCVTNSNARQQRQHSKHRCHFRVAHARAARHRTVGSPSGSGAIRSGISERVFASLPQESERSGESGGGKKVGDSTLLDAAHEYGVSRDRSCREQLAGAAGQRKPAWAGKLDRRIDWALSSRRKPGFGEKNHGCSSSRIDGWRNDLFVRAAAS